MLAKRFYAQLRVLMEFRGYGLQKVLLGLRHAQVHHVAGGHLAHENHQVADAYQALALGHHVLNLDFPQQLGGNISCGFA